MLDVHNHGFDAVEGSVLMTKNLEVMLLVACNTFGALCCFPK